MSKFNRRRVLRGLLDGFGVVVALPLLNVFLNSNGTALADGKPLPVRFGTWGWGMGLNKSVFVPKKTGANFDLPEEIACLAPVQKHINLFTNFDCFRDAAPNLCHKTGWVVMRSGVAPVSSVDLPGETIDVTIAKKIGTTTRFQTLTATATGNVRDSYSYENAKSVNIADWSPVQFYAKVFGEDFQDPNSPEFTPNVRTMVRKSALSGVLDRTKELSTAVGAEDKARIDQFFTGLRDLERQFDQQLTRPEPRAACHPLKAPDEDPKPGLEADVLAQRHKMMTDIMVMAVACDQTRVFNMATTAQLAATLKPGYDKPHHTCTHEEPVDERLGYQPNHSWFVRREMENWRAFVEAFANVKEGDGTLLDNVFIYATTDQSFAKLHAIDGMPMFSAGRAGGRVKTGLHIAGANGQATRLGYTAMQALGLNISSWGNQSNNTSKAFGEILV
jgi:hypothetical protein